MLVMNSSAVVTTGGPVSHIQVLARGMERPAVQVGEDTLRDLTAYKHLIVDGTNGRIAGFF
jgi:phosphoenolpyruvate-protein kinase (PTS system EI component)